MKKALLFFACLITAQLLFAQQRPTDLDKSPMDVSYYPANFPILKMQRQAPVEPFARVLYSRPQKKGRDIFGGEVKYNEVWRMGANEATELELFKNATLGGKKLLKGRYSLFCIPNEKHWTIIVNKDNYSWGSFTYNSARDFTRFNVPVQRPAESIEALTIYFENGPKNNLVIMWDDVRVAIPISF